MDIVSLVPFINLLLDAFGSDAGQAGGVVYDVIQVLAGLHVLAKVARWTAEFTDPEWDDKWSTIAVNKLAKAIEWLSNLASANEPQPRQRILDKTWVFDK